MKFNYIFVHFPIFFHFINVYIRVVVPIYKERLLTNEIIKTLIVAHWIDFLKFLFLFQLETTF